jgi:hypothetical protein
MSTAEETPEVVDTDPAQRPPLSESWPAIARLAFISVYSLTIIIAGFGHWGPSTVRILNAIVAVLWVLLLIMWIRQVRGQTGRFSFVLRHPALPMLLIAPLFLILFWDPIWFIVIVVAFILELRQLSAGDGFTFSFVLIVFVGVMSGLTMVELENNQQSSGIHGPGDAFVLGFRRSAAHRHWERTSRPPRRTGSSWVWSSASAASWLRVCSPPNWSPGFSVTTRAAVRRRLCFDRRRRGGAARRGGRTAGNGVAAQPDHPAAGRRIWPELTAGHR